MCFECAGEKKEIPWGVWLPKSQERLLWNLAHFWFCIVYVLLVPFLACFAPGISDLDHGSGVAAYPWNWLTAMWLVDIFFIVDIYMRLRHFSCLDEKGEDVVIWQQFAEHCTCCIGVCTLFKLFWYFCLCYFLSGVCLHRPAKFVCLWLTGIASFWIGFYCWWCVFPSFVLASCATSFAMLAFAQFIQHSATICWNTYASPPGICTHCRSDLRLPIFCPFASMTSDICTK